MIDAFDAMISNRCYRQGFPQPEAIARLLRSSGSQLDNDVVTAFVPIAEQEATDKDPHIAWSCDAWADFLRVLVANNGGNPITECSLAAGTIVEFDAHGTVGRERYRRVESVVVGIGVIPSYR